jgi:hypothetical protein
MTQKPMRTARLALCAGSLMALGATDAIPPGGPPAALNYTTDCQALASNTLDGFVTNHGWETYRVNGEVRFTFVKGDLVSMSHPEVLARADSTVAPGQTVDVVRTRMLRPLDAGEACRFVVAGTITRTAP